MKTCRWAVIVVLAAGTSPALAQKRPDGIRLGRTTLYPSLEMDISANDNLFQEVAGAASTQIFDYRPVILWRIPLSRSLIELTYRPGLRSYQNGRLPTTVDHELQADIELNFRNRSKLQITNTFESATKELRDVSNSETVFNGDRFVRDDFAAAYAIPLGARHAAEVGGYFGAVRFANPESAAFFDFTDQGLVSAWSVRLTRGLMYRVEARAGSSHQNRAPLTVTEIASGTTVELEGFQEEDFTERIIWSGLDGDLGERFQIRLLLGYGEMLFDNSRETDYRGPVLQSKVEWLLRPSLSMEVQLNRSPNPSSFNVANMFVTELAGLWWVFRTPRRLEMRFGSSKQVNTYRDPVVTDLDRNPGTGLDGLGNDILPNPAAGFFAGAVRRDRADRLEGRVEFTFIQNRLSAYLDVVREERTSNIDFFAFDQTVATFGLRFGWLP